MCVGRTLLSAAFDLDLGLVAAPELKHSNRPKFGGQECPHHTYTHHRPNGAPGKCSAFQRIAAVIRVRPLG